MNKETQKLRESIADCQKKFQELKGDGLSEDPRFEALYNNLGYIIKYIYQVEDSLWNYRIEHAKGHLPQIKGAGKMQKALKTLGMEDDYEVTKPMISVANSKRGIIVEATYKPEDK